MKNNLFSVIITTHNAKNYVNKTIKSVINQNFNDYEIILVDDCSQDGTVELVKEHYKNRIKIFSTKKNFGGPAKSRNIGINESKGDWISFLDGDDYWFQNRLSHFKKLIVSNQDCEVFCSNELTINKIYKSKKVIKHGPYTSNFFEDLLLRGNRLSPSATIIKKKFITKNNILFDISPKMIGVEDYDFWLNLSKNHAKFFFTSKVLNTYIIHNENITNDSLKHMKNTINVISKNFRFSNNLKKKIYLARIFDIKYSFTINQLLKKENIIQNICKFLAQSIRNPVLSTIFILNKINEKIRLKKFIFYNW